LGITAAASAASKIAAGPAKPSRRPGPRGRRQQRVRIVLHRTVPSSCFGAPPLRARFDAASRRPHSRSGFKHHWFLLFVIECTTPSLESQSGTDFDIDPKRQRSASQSARDSSPERACNGRTRGEPRFPKAALAADSIRSVAAAAVGPGRLAISTDFGSASSATHGYASRAGRRPRPRAPLNRRACSARGAHANLSRDARSGTGTSKRGAAAR